MDTETNSIFKLKVAFETNHSRPAWATGRFDLKALWAENDMKGETKRDTRRDTRGTKKDTKSETKKETNMETKKHTNKNWQF